MVAGHWRNGASSQHPQLWSQGTVNGGALGTFQYGVKVTLADGATVFKRNRLTGAIVQETDLSTVASNHLGLPFQIEGDDHFHLAICRTGNGKIHIVGNTHAQNRRYIVSNSADDVSAFSVGTIDTITHSGGTTRNTYNTFVPLFDGTVLWIMDSEIGNDGTGGRRILMYKMGPSASTWSPYKPTEGRIVLSTATGDATPPNWDDQPAQRSYICGAQALRHPTYGPIVGMWGIFRTAVSSTTTPTPTGESQQKPFYLWAYQSDLTNWGGVNSIPANITPYTWDTNTDAFLHPVWRIMSAPQFSRTFGRGIAHDSAGWPHVQLRNGNATTDPTDTKVECYYDGSSWQSRSITKNASTQPTVQNVKGRIVTVTCSSIPRRIQLTDQVTGQIAYIGDEAVPGMDLNPDPVAQQFGSLEFLIPDGDTVKVYSRGRGVRRVT